jgi:hypothetical protein
VKEWASSNSKRKTKTLIFIKHLKREPKVVRKEFGELRKKE